jgi:hypothetical protein
MITFTIRHRHINFERTRIRLAVRSYPVTAICASGPIGTSNQEVFQRGTARDTSCRLRQFPRDAIPASPRSRRFRNVHTSALEGC